MSETRYGPGGYDTAKPHNNVLWQADDATRTVTDYTTNPPTTRPYTAAESAEANAAINAQAAAAAREATRAAVRAIITDLQAEKARAQTVIDKTNGSITGGDTKDVARAAKRIADAAIDLARLVRDMP